MYGVEKFTIQIVRTNLSFYLYSLRNVTLPRVLVVISKSEIRTRIGNSFLQSSNRSEDCHSIDATHLVKDQSSSSRHGQRVQAPEADLHVQTCISAAPLLVQ